MSFISRSLFINMESLTCLREEKQSPILDVMNLTDPKDTIIYVLKQAVGQISFQKHTSY